MRLLALFLLQASPEETLSKRVEEFLSGRDAPIEAIRSAGPSAIGLLRPHRANPKANALLREIREAAAPAQDRPTLKKLASLKFKSDGNRTTFLEALEALLANSVGWTIDPRDADALGGIEVLPPREGTAQDALEVLCDQAKVDFAFLYGLVVIARPERLWPPPPLRNRPLSPEEEVRAKALLPKLGAESPEDRDQAELELRRLGPPVLPILEAARTAKDPEIASRSRRLAEELRPPPPRLFGPPAVDRQTLEGADRELSAKLRERTMTFKVKDLSLLNCLKLLLSQTEGQLLPGEYPPLRVSFSFQDIPVSSILSVLTQSLGMDYMISGGQLVVGPREMILRRVPPQK